MTALLYGESGSGKTTIWGSFPGPILALICSGGKRSGELKSVDTSDGRKKITPKIINSVQQIRGYLEDSDKYATIVLDHVSGLSDLVLKEVLGLETLPEQKSWGMASQQDYGTAGLQCKTILRQLLNHPGNVVIVAQERKFGGKDGDAGTTDELMAPTVGPAVTPSVAGWLCPACDFVVQTFKRPKMKYTERTVGANKVVTSERVKGTEYCLRCEPHDIFMTKFRVPGGVKQDVILDATYEKILAASKGGKVN